MPRTRTENRRIVRGVEKFNITIPTVGNTRGYEDKGPGERGDGAFPYINGRTQSPLSLLGTG